MIRRLILTFAALSGLALAAPRIDTEAFGKSLGPGGWKGDTVSYSLSGSDYRTYKPEISPTPDGGFSRPSNRPTDRRRAATAAPASGWRSRGNWSA